jgi:hypothetical protein
MQLNATGSRLTTRADTRGKLWFAATGAGLGLNEGRVGKLN